jgi:hypothetical protein
LNVYELQPRFSALFCGLDTAFGTGKGQWIKRPPRPEDWVDHLSGRGPGMGIAPLRPDNTVMFAAIDLDEPDFEAAHAMQEFIPGASFIERSRSGNAHVWVFFAEPLEAWVAMGVLKNATVACEKPHTEVFPKNHDFARVKLGNYINLPYYGSERPVLLYDYHGEVCDRTATDFVSVAEETRNDPDKWRKRAQLLLINPPDQRERADTAFGEQENLHICADALISGETPPPTPGHRQVVYFAMAKQLTNWSQVDHDEALELLRSVNEASDEPVPDRELRRILGNAERGQYTSTGCDDPLFHPYAHPKCRIANPR